MAGTNRVNVTINGVRYPIRTIEEPRYVRQLADEMDREVRELMNAGRLSVNEAMVLLSLQYLDSYRKAERNLDNMRDQIAEYLEEAQKARREMEELRQQLDALRGRRQATV